MLEVDDDTFERPPDTVPASVRALITGTYKLDDRLLLVLDTERVVSPVA